MNKTLGSKIFQVCNAVILFLVAVIMVYPYLNVLALSLNDAADSALGGITIMPRVWTIDNFKSVLNSSYIVSAGGVSVARVVIGTLIAIIVQFSASYVMTKRELPGRGGLLMFLTVPMFITGGLVPTYMLYSKIGLLNNFLVYVLPSAFSFYNLIIIRSFIASIPYELQEAAKIDGASEMRILVRIIIPLSLPIIATISLWVAVGYWNDYSTTLYFITQKKYYTLQYVLMQIIKEGERIAQIAAETRNESGTEAVIKITPEALKAAQIVVTTIPIIIVYPFLQKYFVKGVMVGSVKG